MACEQPKILIFTVASWNSKVGANTWETLVNRYDSAQLANIYLRDEIPDSQVCSQYFCISENRILKSIFKRSIKTGQVVAAQPLSQETDNPDLLSHNQRYEKMTKKRRYSMLLARELCWKIGKWKTKELNDFLDAFQPDVILYSMEGYIHLNRLVRYALKRTGARGIGYVWDDTFTYKQSKEFGYKVYRYFQRKSLKKLAKKTQEFFAITPKTKEEADAFFGAQCTVLSKPLHTMPVAATYENVRQPLRMLYTGNLLIGREKSLQKLSAALSTINADGQKIVLDVYTQTQLSAECLQTIETDCCRIHAPIPQSEVLQKQMEADVLLFLEDLSDANLKARLSFSTKITDYFSAGKCIFAIGNPDLAPMQYFKETQSAIVVEQEGTLLPALQTLSQPETLASCAQNAVECGVKNHGADVIFQTFDGVLHRVV